MDQAVESIRLRQSYIKLSPKLKGTFVLVRMYWYRVKDAYPDQYQSSQLKPKTLPNQAVMC